MSANPYAPLINPPKELADRIDAGELSLEDVVKRTRQLTHGLIDAYELTSKSHIFGEHIRSDDIHMRTLIDETILKQPLAYNPNGLELAVKSYRSEATIENRNTGLVEKAIIAHEDALAQHMMTHGARLDCHDTVRLLRRTFRHGTLETVKAVLDWYQRELGTNYTESIQKDIELFGEEDAIGLFSQIFKSTDLESILPKVDFLLGQGFAPFESKEGKRLLVEDAYKSLRRYFEKNTNQATLVLTGLLQRGFGRYAQGWLRSVEDYTYEKDTRSYRVDSRDIQLLAGDEKMKESLERYYRKVNQDWYALSGLYHPEDYLASSVNLTELNAETVSPLHMVQWYSLNRAASIGDAKIWRGHESRLYELYDQMPPHVQEAMCIESKRFQPSPALAKGAIQVAHREAAAKPVGRWVSRVSDVPAQQERG